MITAARMKELRALRERLITAGVNVRDFAGQHTLIGDARLLTAELSGEDRQALAAMEPAQQPRADDVQGSLDFGFALDGSLFS